MAAITHCPICGHGPFPIPYGSSEEIRYSYDICACCGCEYGYDDDLNYFDDWVAVGCPWFHPDAKPEGWSLDRQLQQAIRPWPPGGA